MLRCLLVTSVLLSSSLYAEVGKISRIIGDSGSYLLRNEKRIELDENAQIEEGDEIYSGNSVVLIHLYPASQISLSRNTQIRITQNRIDLNKSGESVNSIINFIKGMVRLQVTKDAGQDVEQKVEAEGVAFSVRGTEFEVTQDNGNYDLDVIEGEVEVSSPFIQTFVPEIVKAQEGFRFNKRQRKFERRRFKLKFAGHPGFESRSELKEKWKLIRQKRKPVKEAERVNKKNKSRAKKRKKKE